MRGMWLAGGATLLGGGAYLGGAFDRGEYYAMNSAAVETRLAGLEFGDEAHGTQAKLVLRSRGPAVVRWDLMLEGDRVADVRAHLSPEAPGTRVLVEFAFMKGDGLMGLEDDPFLNEIAAIAMEEKVDSTLDGRAFNETLVQAKIAAAVAANPQAITNLQKSLQKNVSEEMSRVSKEMSREEEDFYDGNGYGNAKGNPPVATDFDETHADGGWGNN